MTNDHDPLERELAAMTPRAPSTMLRQRIDRRLNRRRRGWLGLVALLAVLLAVPLALRRRDPEAPRPAPVPAPAPATVLDESLPTLQTYRRALNRSPEELDSLLSRHADGNRDNLVFSLRSNPDLIFSPGGR